MAGKVVREILRPGADITREITPSFITDFLPRSLGGTPPGGAAPPARREAAISEQTTAESRRLAESTSDVERRKALLQRGGGSGRSLLVRTSPTGIPSSPATTSLLGGTA